VLASRIHPIRNAYGGLLPPSYEYEPTLGFFNPQDYRTAALTFDSQGFRAMPPLGANAVPVPPILSTGDSYTMGDEAGDAESWPAQLQTVLGWRTINAGVSGYGLDQTVLLSERLARRVKPAALVVGFIADDVRRVEMSRIWGREKSYFELVGGELALRNVPVPQTRDLRETLTPLQRAFGWSVLLDTVLDRLGLRDLWYTDEIRALPAGAGERLACPLMRRLSALGVPTLVVAQYLPTAWDSAASGAEEHRIARVVLDCAEQAALATLDLYGAVGDAVQAGGREAVPTREGTGWPPRPSLPNCSGKTCWRGDLASHVPFWMASSRHCRYLAFRASRARAR
jgi:hypothetical protein